MPTAPSKSTCSILNCPFEGDSTICVHFTRILTAAPCRYFAEISGFARLRPFGSRFPAPGRLRSVGRVASTRTESLTLRPEGAASRQGNGPHADDQHQQRKPKADPGG